MASGGAAPGSDIYLGYVASGICAAGCVNDYSTRVYDKPTLDSTQNVEVSHNMLLTHDSSLLEA